MKFFLIFFLAITYGFRVIQDGNRFTGEEFVSLVEHKLEKLLYNVEIKYFNSKNGY